MLVIKQMLIRNNIFTVLSIRTSYEWTDCCSWSLFWASKKVFDMKQKNKSVKH